MGDGGSREAPDSSTEAPGYVRVPLPIAAAGVIVVLAVLLAIGLYANANLRSRGVILPTPATAVAAETPAVPTAAPATPLAALTTATPVPAAATATSPPALTAAPTPAATPQAVVAVESATPTPAPAMGLASPTPSPTVEPTLALEVGAAYERYWQVRSQALLDLDKSHLAEAMGGDHLASTSNLIDELVEENRAIQTSVDHDYQVVEASDGSAEIFDDYLSSSFYVDPQSLKPLSAPASDELRVLYQLIHVDGVWKVIDSVRAD